MSAFSRINLGNAADNADDNEEEVATTEAEKKAEEALMIGTLLSNSVPDSQIFVFFIHFIFVSYCFVFFLYERSCFLFSLFVYSLYIQI